MLVILGWWPSQILVVPPIFALLLTDLASSAEGGLISSCLGTVFGIPLLDVMGYLLDAARFPFLLACDTAYSFPNKELGFLANTTV
jgi:hypothetical protein